jgi:hypothetical protein
VPDLGKGRDRTRPDNEEGRRVDTASETVRDEFAKVEVEKLRAPGLLGGP